MMLINCKLFAIIIQFCDMTVQLHQKLRDHGFSVTKPRLAVFDYLREHDPTLVAELIAAQAGRINQASVYRSLALFKRLGIIQDVVVGGRRMIELSDHYDTHHHHISCVRCGMTVTIGSDPIIEQRLNALAKAHGIIPNNHQVEVSGLCADCSA
jgi:Fur family ferric uptake transcriptional regulator